LDGLAQEPDQLRTALISMTVTPDLQRKTATPALWIVLALLSLSLLINYVDRSSISIAAPLIRNEFGLSASQLGVLFSAFSWTYAFCLILSGWLADRFNASWVLAIGFTVWSVATLLTGLANGLAMFLVLRLLLGMGESVAYPCYSRLVVRHFPETRRGLANSIISIGMPGGLAVGTFAGAILMGRFGWRPFFIVLGLGTMLWLVPWFVFMPRHKGPVRSSTDFSPPIWELLAKRSLWGTCIGLFGLNFLLYFMINWLPLYLVQERGFAMDRIAAVGIVYLIAALISPAAGWLSDYWIAAGGTPTLARKTVMAGGQTLCGLSLIACVTATGQFALLFLFLAGVGFGFSNSQTWAIAQSLAGPNASGKWTGLQNFVGNFAGILGPIIAGELIDRTGGFFWAFTVTAVVGVLGAASWLFVVGPLQAIDWDSPASSVLPSTSTGSP
jgi:ACS family D-galactonate transporter-like MFS transporter